MEATKSQSFRLDDMMPLFREYLAAGKSVRFSPMGVSMLPMLRQGKDRVVLSPLPEQLRKYDIALYRRDSGAYVLHRIIAAGETYTCIGDNQYTYETGLHHDQMIGIVTGFERNGKLHSVQEPGYLLYCRFWHATRSIRYFFLRVRNKLRRLLG